MKPKFELVLDDDQLRAIGHVAAQWAFMEYLVDSFFGHLATTRLRNNIPEGNELSFIGRIRTYRSALDPNDPKDNNSIDILDKIGNIIDKRQKIIHGQWGVTGFPEKLELYGKRGKNDYLQKMTARKIEKVALQISEISALIVKQFLPASQKFPF